MGFGGWNATAHGETSEQGWVREHCFPATTRLPTFRARTLLSAEPRMS